MSQKESENEQDSNFEMNQFNLKCDKHSNNYICYYCKHCQKNICENCVEHLSHEIIPFSKIGLNEEEYDKIEKLLKEIENKLYCFNKIKEDIEDYFNKMKIIEQNKLIYENDTTNNYKEYIINYLELIKNKLEISEINLNELISDKKEMYKDNYIISIYDIKRDKKDKYDYNIQKTSNKY